MLTFKQFMNQKHPLEDHPVLNNFLHHLSSNDIEYPTNEDIYEAEIDPVTGERKPFTKKELGLRASDIRPVNKALKKRKWAFTGAPPPKEKKQPRAIDDIMREGQSNQPQKKLFPHIKEGFHAAFPEGETPEETKRKALEARKHFRQFLTQRGGHAEGNSGNLTGDNGKTRLSTGEGMQTIGLSLAPHESSGYSQNLCPNASSECKSNCLGFTAGGNKQYPETSFRAKLLRTQYLAEHPENAARLMSHEIGENEEWASNHHTVHDQSGNIVGYRNKQSGKITSEMPVTGKTKEEKSEQKKQNEETIRKGLESGTHTTKEIKPGFRGNMTSDLAWEKLMPPKFFQRHNKTQFYDYTKNAARVMNKDKLPPNYSLALSHTGTGHEESNDAQAVKALNAGHVVAMVHQRLKKGQKPPTHVEDVQTGKRWKIVNGDEDDNVYDRHRAAGVDKSEGVVSGLHLKGVSNEAAGKFANKVDDDGIIRINHPKEGTETPKFDADKAKSDFEARAAEFRKQLASQKEKV